MGVQKPGFLRKYWITALNLLKNPVSLVGVWRGGQKPGFYPNTWLQHAKTAKNPVSSIGVRGGQKPGFYPNTWLQHAKTAKNPVSSIGVRKSWMNLATKSSNKFLLNWWVTVLKFYFANQFLTPKLLKVWLPKEHLYLPVIPSTQKCLPDRTWI